MLSSWDELKHWLEQEKEAIIVKNWLADEARRWQKIRSEDESKAQDDLLKGSRLAQVVEFRNKDAFKNFGGLSTQEEEYINASVEWSDRQLAEKKRQLRTRKLLGSAILAMATLVIAVPLTLAGNVLSTLRHKPNVIFAQPGQLIDGKTKYRLTYTPEIMKNWTNSPTTHSVINQIVLGIPGENESTACIDVGVIQNDSDMGDKEQRSYESISLNAPKKPGVYYIRFGMEMQYNCKDAKNARQDHWKNNGLSKPESEKSIIGVVIVGNPLDIILHWSEIQSAFNENVPNTLTKVKPEEKGAIYTSLYLFSINPAKLDKQALPDTK